MTDRPEGNDTVVSKGECPKCGSSKGFVTYADGHKTCYGAGCNYFVPAPKDGSTFKATEVKDKGGFGHDTGDLLTPTPPHGYTALSKRRITEDTCRKYGVFLAPFNKQVVQVYPYFDFEGNPAVQKLRFPDKEFLAVKAPNAPGLAQCRLFGHQVYGDRFDRQLIITEGELDALSVAQVLDFKTAVVSIGTGAGSNAAKHLKANYLWVDRFAEIVLWFDDDEAGKIAVEECAKLFKVGKVRIAKCPGYKDASDILQATQDGLIRTAIYAATAWRPKGIVNAADDPKDVCAPTAEDQAFTFNWPWSPVQNMLGPILPGQVCYHVAGTGIGKSTGVAEIEVDLLKQGARIAHLSFEDTRRESKLRLLSTWVGARLDIDPRPDDQMVALHEEFFGHRRLELFDPETAEWTVEAILGYIRYCAKGLDCQVIFLDPLSFIVAGLSAATDERRALDSVSRDIAALAKELGVHIQVTHHLSRPQGLSHEEGAQTSLNQVRGSGGIANFATFVIGHERNQQAEGDDSLLTQLRSLKNRPRSRTGVMLTLAYDLSTGRLAISSRPFPKPGAAGGGEGHQTAGRSFGNAEY